MVMDAQRIILVNGSRLLGDMLHKVISRADHLEIVQEVSRYEEIPMAIERTKAEWVLMSLPFETSFPRWVDDHLAEHPAMRFLAIFLNSGKVRLKWPGSPDEELEDLSLDDLIYILEGHLQPLQGFKKVNAASKTYEKNT